MGGCRDGWSKRWKMYVREGNIGLWGNEKGIGTGGELGRGGEQESLGKGGFRKGNYLEGGRLVGEGDE